MSEKNMENTEYPSEKFNVQPKPENPEFDQMKKYPSEHHEIRDEEREKEEQADQIVKQIIELDKKYDYLADHYNALGEMDSPKRSKEDIKKRDKIYKDIIDLIYKKRDSEMQDKIMMDLMHHKSSYAMMFGRDFVDFKDRKLSKKVVLEVLDYDKYIGETHDIINRLDKFDDNDRPVVFIKILQAMKKSGNIDWLHTDSLKNVLTPYEMSILEGFQDREL